MKMVLIQWVDSVFVQGWRDLDSIKSHRVSDCVSIGILMNETKDWITIVQSKSDESYGDGITIPKVCIKQMWKLKTQ